MAAPVTPTPDILARRRFLSNATTRAISSTSATTTLTHGVWELTTDIDCFFLQGDPASVSATTTASVPLWAKTYVEIYVSDNTDTGIAVVSTSASGTLYCCKVA